MVRATCVGVWVWVVCAGVAWGQAPRMRGAGELPATLLAAFRQTGGSENARRCSLFAS